MLPTHRQCFLSRGFHFRSHYYIEGKAGDQASWPSSQLATWIKLKCHVKCFLSSAGWAFHISWSKCCLSVWMYVWMLTRVAETTAHRDLYSCLHRPTNETWLHTKIQVSLTTTYFTDQNRPPKKVGVKRHFQVSWASQPMGCLLHFIIYDRQ